MRAEGRGFWCRGDADRFATEFMIPRGVVPAVLTVAVALVDDGPDDDDDDSDDVELSIQAFTTV